MRARNVPRNFGSRPAFFSHIDDSAATSSSRRRLLRVVDRKWYHVFTRINESWCSEHFIPLWRRRLRALSDARSAELARGGGWVQRVSNFGLSSPVTVTVIVKTTGTPKIDFHTDP